MMLVRKDLLALGIILLFLGLIFTSISREAVKPEPEGSWVPLAEAKESKAPFWNLFVEGDLKQGDKFRIVYREGMWRSELIVEGGTVYINLTDPWGHIENYEILYELSADEQLVPVEGGRRLPSEFLANDTGSYKVSAEAIWGVSLTYLALVKFELKEKEPYYPNSNLFPIGVVTIFGGVGVSLLGAKISKSKKIRKKGRLH